MAVKINSRVQAQLRLRKKSLEEWHNFMGWSLTKQAPRWVFRGQSQHWPLKPSVARLNRYKPELEILLLNEFKRHSVSHFNTNSISDEWNWLALAQHHGLPTRLLDWTYNPLVAAYFASKHSPRGKKNGFVYAVEVREYGFTDEFTELDDPFQIEKDVFLRTPSHIPRIRSQKGLFSVHANPLQAFASGRFAKFEIFAEHKNSFRRLAYNLGIDAGFLMADLDGLSESLTWRYENGFIA